MVAVSAVASVISFLPLRRVRASMAVVAVLLSVFVLSGCNSGEMRRPPGYLRLGPVQELAAAPSRYFSDLKIYLRRDGRGFFAMSTACTYDLSPLILSGEPGRERWKSTYSTSEYQLDGTVVKGPTRAPLPYYALRIAAGEYGGTPDTLFVEIGNDRPKDWRLPIP